jgi:hypothetical protein
MILGLNDAVDALATRLSTGWICGLRYAADAPEHDRVVPR